MKVELGLTKKLNSMHKPPINVNYLKDKSKLLKKLLRSIEEGSKLEDTPVTILLSLRESTI